jgi:hypothetical protein
MNEFDTLLRDFSAKTSQAVVKFVPVILEANDSLLEMARAMSNLFEHSLIPLLDIALCKVKKSNRRYKQARRQRRAQFLARGKHGLRRPKHKRG